MVTYSATNLPLTNFPFMPIPMEGHATAAIAIQLFARPDVREKRLKKLFLPVHVVFS